MKTVYLALWIFLIVSLSLSFFASANGGDQRVVEGKYIINLSRAPFTPRDGDKVQMLASFVDLKTNKLVSEDMIVKIRISKLGGGIGKREFVYEQDNLKVTGGVLGFSYIFQDAGLHEIFFDFMFVSNQERIYEAPDFLIDVQKQENSVSILNPLLASIGTGVVGIIIGFLLNRIKIRKKS